MKKLILIFPLFCLFASCQKQVETEIPQISQPKHFIYGKWKLVPKYPNEPKITLDFRENTLLVVTSEDKNSNKIFTEDYVYSIIDESTVDFYYSETINTEKISIIVKAVTNTTIKTSCYKTGKSKVNDVILDPPLLCFLHDYKKIDE